MKNQMPLCARRRVSISMSERGVVPMSPTLQQIFFEQYAGRTCGFRAYWDGPAVAVRAMAGNLRMDRPSMRRTRRSPRSRSGVARRLKTFDDDAKAARPWEDVLADLKARRPLPPSPRWRGPFASAL
jgi:hypothetical protein